MKYYPTLLAAYYCHILNIKYGLNHDSIFHSTGCDCTQLATLSEIHYPDNLHVQRMILLLDSLGHFSEPAPTLISLGNNPYISPYNRNLVMGLLLELYDCPTLERFLLLLAHRFSTLYPANHYWIEKDEFTLYLCFRHSIPSDIPAHELSLFGIISQLSRTILGMAPLTMQPHRLNTLTTSAIPAVFTLAFPTKQNVMQKTAPFSTLSTTPRPTGSPFLFEDRSSKLLTHTIYEMIAARIINKGELLQLSDVCKLLDTSPRLIRQRLKNENESFIPLKKSAIFNSALSLLLTNKNSITEVAKMVGFSEYQAFLKSFKKYFGTAPGSLVNHRTRTTKP